MVHLLFGVKVRRAFERPHVFLFFSLLHFFPITDVSCFLLDFSFLLLSLLLLIGETVIWELIPSPRKICAWVSKVKAFAAIPFTMLPFAIEKIGIGYI